MRPLIPRLGSRWIMTAPQTISYFKLSPILNLKVVKTFSIMAILLLSYSLSKNQHRHQCLILVQPMRYKRGALG